MTDTSSVVFDREYRTKDKSDWQPGPWMSEPDKAQWIDAATGLDCLIVRNGSGALCGYVGLPPEHPWHGKGYAECLVADCDNEYCYDCTPDGSTRVHGGLTFAAPCADTDDEARHICHVPAEGRPADVWWFGFDCAHSNDKSPAYREAIFDGIYRDVPYVVAECASLARQLVAVTS